MLSAPAIRRAFIEFFVQGAGHTVVPSSPVVPHDDPTLLFTNAGMNQFKDVFLGRGTRPYRRAVNSQKCIRAGGKHNDLEDVGRDTYHHTFFEMLGNWSFGDYFKTESIAWGWELLTTVLGVAPDRLYATYFEGSERLGLEPDADARDLWLSFLPPERVLPGGMKDNFWEMGETGPCGPCSEIHYDRIGGRNAAALVNQGDPDVLEIWNHVFIQFNRESESVLKALPARHVDTGMGFERLVSVMQGKRSNYDTDLWAPLFAAIRLRTKARPYQGALNDPVDVAYRVIADHMRCLTVALTDGAVPGSEGRGYVLRRILRRAVRHGHQTLGVQEPFLHDLVPAVVDSLGEAFPELRSRPQRVAELLRDEELAFGRTLERGLALFSEAATRAKGGGRLGGDVAFKLHDTYGFPIDLTQVMAEERGLAVDVSGYERLMEAAREVSRRGTGAEAELTLSPEALAGLPSLSIHPTEDVDKYVSRPMKAEVRAIWDGASFENFATVGRRVALILDRTNHYAESGGQEGDHGRFRVDLGRDSVEELTGRPERGGTTFEVADTRSVGGYVLHIGHVTEGTLHVGERGTLSVSRDRRDALRANHTATHLLNLALRQILGETDQRGSLVAADRLRFDYSCPRAPTIEEIARIEAMIEAAIAADLPVHAELVPLSVARNIHGLRAVFGERYPDPVRVVAIGERVDALLAQPDNARWMELSIEFCGGTHLASSGEARSCVIISESALAAGTRRIFALTGVAANAAKAAAAQLQAQTERAAGLSEEELPAEFDEIAAQVDSLPMGLVARRRVQVLAEALRERVKLIRRRAAGESRGAIVDEARRVAESASSPVIIHGFDRADRDQLLAAMDTIRSRCARSAIMLFGSDATEGRVTIVASSPPELVKAGLKAGDWVREAAQACGGSGGGRPDMAQAGGKDPGKLMDAMAAAASFANARVSAC
jgi:alanyl-tRNA synthetase